MCKVLTVLNSNRNEILYIYNLILNIIYFYYFYIMLKYNLSHFSTINPRIRNSFVI